jgi:hypothetical protein
MVRPRGSSKSERRDFSRHSTTNSGCCITAEPALTGLAGATAAPAAAPRQRRACARPSIRPSRSPRCRPRGKKERARFPDSRLRDDRWPSPECRRRCHRCRFHSRMKAAGATARHERGVVPGSTFSKSG